MLISSKKMPKRLELMLADGSLAWMETVAVWAKTADGAISDIAIKAKQRTFFVNFINSNF